MPGLVLVWDLDNTLVGNYIDPNNKDELLELNNKALSILNMAVQARARGIVDAIFLLTNNSDEIFIDYVVKTIEDIFNMGYVFDYMMDRNEPYRPISDNPPKRLEDVAYMLKMLGMTTASLRNRVFFFDDIPDHQIRREIPGHHYIQITPRFYNNTEEDKTNYRPLLAAMNERMPRTQRLAAKIGGGESRKSTKRAHANRRGSRRNAGSQRAGSRSKKYRKKNLMNILSDI